MRAKKLLSLSNDQAVTLFFDKQVHEAAREVHAAPCGSEKEKQRLGLWQSTLDVLERISPSAAFANILTQFNSGEGKPAFRDALHERLKHMEPQRQAAVQLRDSLRSGATAQPGQDLSL